MNYPRSLCLGCQAVWPGYWVFKFPNFHDLCIFSMLANSNKKSPQKSSPQASRWFVDMMVSLLQYCLTHLICAPVNTPSTVTGYSVEGSNATSSLHSTAFPQWCSGLLSNTHGCGFFALLKSKHTQDQHMQKKLELAAFLSFWRFIFSNSICIFGFLTKIFYLTLCFFCPRKH